MALVLINPVSGDKSAPSFFSQHVLPLLPTHTLATTSAESDAGPIVAQYLADQPGTDAVTVILGSGDGTLHEIINATSHSACALNVVLIPCGTANALYASLVDKDPNSKLQSLQAYLDHKTPKRLSLATTTLSSEQISVSSVVVSTSLHASILHDSESLRDRYPGIERFKIAAQQNSSKWYRARVRLAGAVQIYDPKSKAFIPHPDAELAGPFAYFLSTVNVDRLEPAFRISPLARTIPSPPSTCDIVILRPLRDPSVSADTPETRTAFVPKTWHVLGGAYQDGAHIDLTYAQDGAISLDGDIPVVEYIRCGGWEWIPDVDDADAHLVCTDGAIARIPPSGKAVCAIDASKHAVSVYA